MDCLKSFSFKIENGSNFTGTTVKQWTVGAVNNYWAVRGGGTSQLNFEGFKNINIFGIDVVGGINTQQTAATGGVIVNDWQIHLQIEGTLPLINSFVTPSPNFFGLLPISNNTNKLFTLGKYCNSLKFVEPIQSVQYIQINETNASGIGWQTAGSCELYYNFNFIVYYNYEGE
jgi:hypothetical protein